jgi:hypothetical protein
VSGRRRFIGTPSFKSFSVVTQTLGFPQAIKARIQHANVDNSESVALRLHHRTDVHSAIAAEQKVRSPLAEPIAKQSIWYVLDELKRAFRIGR